MTIARTRRHVPADSIQALADHSFGLGAPWRVKEVRVALSGPGLTGAYPELGRHPLASDGAGD